MPSTSNHTLINCLRVMVVGAWRNDPRTDAELLAEFADTRDEMAFAALMWRHGVLVWRTCRNILGDTPDAEDAFQTTFLTLSRKAPQLRRDQLAGWLHQVARRAALNIQIGVRRRQNLEQKLRTAADTQVDEEKEKVSRDKLYLGLDEELAGMPEKLRVPLLLHYLEGKTQDEVARILSCSRRTIRERLEKGEAVLRKRLERRGLTLGGTSMVALFATTSGMTALPARLIESTSRAAVAFRAGTLCSDASMAAEKMLHSLAMKKAGQNFAWILMACFGFAGIGGAGLIAWKMNGDGSNDVKSKVPLIPEKGLPIKKVELVEKRVDCNGDSLPEGAIARIGTNRFRTGSVAGSIGESGDSAFFPDAKTIASVHRTKFVYFWETSTGKEIRRLELPSVAGQTVAISADGKKLAVLGKDSKSGLIEVRDLSVDPPQQIWRHDLSQLSKENGWRGLNVAFSPNEQMLALVCGSLTSPPTLWLFDSKGNILGKQVINLGVIFNQDAKLAFSSDSKMLIAGNTLWNVATGKRYELEKMLESESKWSAGYISSAFSADNKRIAIYGFRKKASPFISIWDLVSNKECCQIPTDTLDEAGLDFICFLPDGQTLLQAGRKQICLFDSSTGRAKSLTEVSGGDLHEFEGARYNYMHLSPNGKYLASVRDMEISVWDVTTGKKIEQAVGFHELISALALSPDSKHLATLTGAGPGLNGSKKLRLWETDTGRPWHKLEQADDLHGARSIEYSESGSIALTRGIYKDLYLITNGFTSWDLETGWPSSSQLPPVNEALCVSTSPNGRWQLWATKDAHILVDRTTGKEVCSFQGMGTIMKGAKPFETPERAISVDGRTVLFIWYDQINARLGVLSTTTGLQKISFEIDSSKKPDTNMVVIPRVQSPFKNAAIALSPDGHWLAIATDVGIRLWEVASGAEGITFKPSDAKPSDAAITDISWSRDSHLLTGGDVSGVVRIWDAMSGQELRRLTGHFGGITTLEFSPDAHRLASGSSDTTVLVWDISNLPRPEVKDAQWPSTDVLLSSLQKSALQKDVVKAQQMMSLLIQNPDKSLPLLQKLLQPIPPSDPKLVTALLTQIDDDDFQVRQRAEKQLNEMGEEIEPVLQKALTKQPSLEVRKIIERLLAKFGVATQTGLSVSRLQVFRCVEVLEKIGTPEARKLLEELSRLPEEFAQSKEARAALQRLTMQTPAFK